jgi:hypothetical protein
MSFAMRPSYHQMSRNDDPNAPGAAPHTPPGWVKCRRKRGWRTGVRNFFETNVLLANLVNRTACWARRSTSDPPTICGPLVKFATPALDRMSHVALPEGWEQAAPLAELNALPRELYLAVEDIDHRLVVRVFPPHQFGDDGDCVSCQSRDRPASIERACRDNRSGGMRWGRRLETPLVFSISCVLHLPFPLCESGNHRFRTGNRKMVWGRRRGDGTIVAGK